MLNLKCIDFLLLRKEC